MDGDLLEMTFDGELWYWRGPAPFYFVTVPDEPSAAIRALASVLSYGWGVIPVTVRLGGSTWTTSLFPRTGGTSSPSRTPSAGPRTSRRAMFSRLR